MNESVLTYVQGVLVTHGKTKPGAENKELNTNQSNLHCESDLRWKGQKYKV